MKGNCLMESLAQMFYPVSTYTASGVNYRKFYDSNVIPLAEFLRKVVCDYEGKYLGKYSLINYSENLPNLRWY